MISGEKTHIVLEADRDHAGLRLLVLLSLALAFGLVFLLVKALLDRLPPGGIGDFSLALSCAGALAAGALAASLAERGLKRVWPSGRRLILQADGLQAVVHQDGAPLWFDAPGRLATVRWYFSLRGFTRGGRERRVPASWLCLACQLQQEQQQLAVFSLMPRGRAAAILADDSFTEIRPAEQFSGGSRVRTPVPVRFPELPAELLSGPTGPHWLAERRRWAEGMELSPADFGTLLDWIDEHDNG